MDRTDSVRTLLDGYRGSTTLPEHAVKGFLREAGLPAPRGLFVPPGASFPDLSRLSFPLVAKVSSTRIRSKSDVGGIRRGLRDSAEASQAVADLMGIEYAEGVVLEEEAPPGVEVIVGGTRDAQFGPVVMFGLGGVLVELFHDVAFAVAPMTRADAFRLMQRVKGYPLLTGFRGTQPCDLDALADTLVIVSEIMASGLLAEIDLNPVACYPRGAMILDAKMFVATHREETTS
ncbi:acyl-CoA synthetase [bacterium]|nr:acyl-CoA synthetase [bacterium]